MEYVLKREIEELIGIAVLYYALPADRRNPVLNLVKNQSEAYRFPDREMAGNVKGGDDRLRDFDVVEVA